MLAAGVLLHTARVSCEKEVLAQAQCARRAQCVGLAQVATHVRGDGAERHWRSSDSCHGSAYGAAQHADGQGERLGKLGLGTGSRVHLDGLNVQCRGCGLTV